MGSQLIMSVYTGSGKGTETLAFMASTKVEPITGAFHSKILCAYTCRPTGKDQLCDSLLVGPYMKG